MNFEVRYMGALIGHFDTEKLANAYRESRLSHPVEGKAFVPAELTVAPRRPVSLFCNGNLVDTFKTDGEATAKRDALLQQAEDLHRRSPVLEDFEVTTNRTAKPRTTHLPEVDDPAAP